jgi:glucose-fructose oxidoreductase
MDYCCYGANLSCYLLGAPQSVTGAGGKFVKQEDIPFDNAILLLQYAGAVGVAEASWTQVGHPPYYELVVMGSAGSIVAPQGDSLTLVTPEAPEGQRVDAPALPAGRDNEAAYFLSCLLEQTQPEGMLSPQVCLDAQAVLEAGARAIREGRNVALPLEA